MFPDCLIDKWPKFKARIISIYKAVLNKSEDIPYIDQLEDEEVPDPTKDFLVLYLLAQYILPSKRVRNYKPSICESRNSFILHVLVS